MNKMIKLIFITILFLVFYTCFWQKDHKNTGDFVSCDKWISKVDPSVKYINDKDKSSTNQNSKDSIVILSMKTEYDDSLSDDQVMEAIYCLLKCKGNKNKARFSGVTKPTISQRMPDASIELAALYYISFLYWKKWDHADGIALRDKDGKINPDDSIEIAYESYKKWYVILKSIGLKKAREKKLDPLEGTELFWYGNWRK